MSLSTSFSKIITKNICYISYKRKPFRFVRAQNTRPGPCPVGWGGGGTPLHLPYRYMPPERVWLLRRFGLKAGIDFTYFGLNSGTVFEGMHERICHFNSE